MRTTQHILFSVVFFLAILPVIIIPPQISGTPDEVISTHNLMLMAKYPDDRPDGLLDRSVVSGNYENIPEQVSASGPNASLPIPVGLSTLANYPLPFAPVPTPTPTMAKGWVEVNLGTSIDSAGMMVEDRQRYMASGLFNVHVYHEYAG